MDNEQLAEGSEPEDVGNEDQPVLIYKATCIKGPGLRSPWMPAVQTVSGVEYVKLVKWDRDLTLFCTGQPMNLHTKAKKPLNNINVAWFEEMKTLRQQACDSAVKKVILEAAEAEGKPPPAKIRAAQAEDEFLVGGSVVLDVPDIYNKDNEDEVVEPGRQLRVLWGVKGEIWVELTEANLRYVRQAIRHSTPFVQQRSKRCKGSPGRRAKKRGRKPIVAGDDPADPEEGERQLDEEAFADEQG
eukprot:s52_g20.t1